MKTTVELPDHLLKQVKLRAVREGRKLKDALADLLRKGLDAEEPSQPTRRRADIRKDPLTGLPVIRCPHAAGPGEDLTPARLSAILLGQEIEWHHGALADTNFWIALTFSGHGHHQAARAWLAGQRGAESALFCRSTQQSFLRLITTAAVCRPLGVPPLGNRDAWSVFEGFAADPRVGWADEPPGLAAQWKRLSSGSAPSPKLWMDAYLAAFALVGRHGIVTTDKAFKQFKSVAVVLLEAT